MNVIKQNTGKVVKTALGVGALVALAFFFNALFASRTQRLPPTISQPEPEKPRVKGNITEVHQADAEARGKGIIGSIMIEDAETKYSKTSVAITDKTLIFEKKGQNRSPVTFQHLKIGQRVEGQVIALMESYPMQAKVSEIVILK